MLSKILLPNFTNSVCLYCTNVPKSIWSNGRFSWAPLTKTFNVRPTTKFNFFKGTESTGLFNNKLLRNPSGFYILQQECFIKAEDLTREALSDTRMRKMVEIFDELSDCICQVADLAEFIRLAHPDNAYREAAENTCLSLGKIVEELNTNRRLYLALKDAVKRGDVKITDEVDNLVGDLFLFDFEQNGIHLPEDDRMKVVALNDYILNLGQRFVAGTDKPRIINGNKLPKEISTLFKNYGEDIIISGLFIDSANPKTREMTYRFFLAPDPDQNSVLNRLLQSRYDLARICGFSSYSDRVLRGGAIDNPPHVMEFLDTTSTNIKDFTKFDFDVMRKMKNAESENGGDLAPWDVPYFALKAKRALFNVSQKEYAPYFSLGACMEGLNILFQNLFGISLINVMVTSGEVWNEDIYKLAVVHESEGTLGHIYCDFYERPGKQNQDCHFTIRGGRQLNENEYQTPIVVLMLNLPLPQYGIPSLLTPQMVDNLFHEMGHAMHSMLARTKYQHVTGTRCSTDFAEVPSVLMEYFASDPRILGLFARHYSTKEPLPDELMEKLCASKKVFTASDTQLQIFYAALDQVFHGKFPLPKSTTDILKEVQEKYYGLTHVPNTGWHLRFSHLVGYGAKYYSYLVSRSVAHWIWQRYFQTDPLSRDQGDRYRRECLAHGGGKNPKKLIADFLKIEPIPSVFAKSISMELLENNKHIISYNKFNKLF